MNIGWNIETYMTLFGIFASTIGSVFIIKTNWKQYGLLFILSCVAGELLCYFFVKTNLYSYPYRLFPHFSPMPFFLVLTMFPFYILLGVKYSPSSWAYKIPFYWVIVHIGMTLEVLAQNFTKMIKYESFWDTWDSYTWWWLYLLVFEIVGGAVVSKQYRKPLDEKLLSYGKAGWFIVHFVLIATIFLAGFYMGVRVTR